MAQNKIEIKVDTLNVLTDIVTEWFVERNLHTLDGSGQLTKLQEEVKELLDATTEDEEVDAIGDITVVLIGYALMRGHSFTDCLAYAYTQIKDRAGYVNEDGVFIKDVPLKPQEE